jgi:hypothetical protein
MSSKLCGALWGGSGVACKSAWAEGKRQRRRANGLHATVQRGVLTSTSSASVLSGWWTGPRVPARAHFRALDLVLAVLYPLGHLFRLCPSHEMFPNGRIFTKF